MRLQYGNIEKKINENRRKSLLENPSNIQKIYRALKNLDPRTITSESFIMLNDSEKHIIISSCRIILKFLN